MSLVYDLRLKSVVSLLMNYQARRSHDDRGHGDDGDDEQALGLDSFRTRRPGGAGKALEYCKRT